MPNHIASTVVMVPPDHFAHNTSTSASNRFQNIRPDSEINLLRSAATTEFDNMRTSLERAGINVHIMPVNRKNLPDAVFPNNWFCTLPGGKLVLFPMMAENRREERIPESVNSIRSLLKISENEIIDLTSYELNNQFLEGTGSMVFDHKNKIGIASISDRTNKELVEILCSKINYSPLIIRTRDINSKPIYHTNVLLSVLEKQLVVCADVVFEKEDLLALERLAADTDRVLIPMDLHQMECFACNILQLSNAGGDLILVMSEKAYNSLTRLQIELLSSTQEIVIVDIDNIENTGGGGARCMIAEIFN